MYLLLNYCGHLSPVSSCCLVKQPPLKSHICGLCCADWWSKPDFVLNELNVQSVVTAPAHDEMIPLVSLGMYTIKGFAYSGVHASLLFLAV